MPPNRDERAGAGQRTPSPSGAHGWRAGLALGRRWAVRAVAGYAALFVLLIVGSLILRPHQDWSAVGGPGTVALSLLALMVLVSPVLGAMGAALAGTVWVALRVSRGSQGAGALATGIAGVGLSMRFVVVYPDPRLVDLLAYLGLSVGIGAVAARTTLRDVARVRPVTAWLADLRQRRPEPAP